MLIRTHGKCKWTGGPGRAQSGWYSGKDSHTAAGPARRSTSAQRDGVSTLTRLDRLGGVCVQEAMADDAARVPSRLEASDSRPRRRCWGGEGEGEYLRYSILE